ncbi:MAG: DUF1838 domain-containing protein [Anaerolineae bacterium]|nr:DUF1838 domain-containing protein [Anaerolineae bacterium]
MSTLSPHQALSQFIKVRSSLDPNETSVFWWTGTIYAQLPHQPYQKLFQFEGFNIGRCETIEGGYRMITREAAFYKDPKTGQILDRWTNPFTQETVDVVHVWNDPVNQTMVATGGPRGPFSIPITDLGGDDRCMWMDVTLAYPTPLSRAQYPDYVQNELYVGAELFQFFYRQSEVDNPALASVPCQNSCTRIASWVPFMKMADRAGGLVYQCRGGRVAGGYAALSAEVRAYVEQHQPKYASAPAEWVQPNETSWTYMKKVLEGKAA